MAQKTISELEEVPSSRPTPISVSLMAKVIKIGHVAKFKTSNGEEAEMINFSLADKSGAILATCTDTSKDRMIKEGKTLHIREFILKNGRVAMSHKTKILAKPNMDIPVDILQKAEHLILPPSPIKKVEEILASPLRSITTVQGQLSKIESTKTVKVNGTDTVIRTISIEENGKKIDVTLWREMAEEDLKIGQYLSISHCMLNEWQLHKSLNTTRNSKIQIIQPQTTTVSGNIDSITLNDIAVEIALKEDFKEEYKDFSVDLAIIRSVFPDTLQVRVEDLEKYFLQKLPILVELIVQGSNVQNMHLIEQPAGSMDHDAEQ
ncbi:uncharacterized protein LOC128172870 [Crassostrea angulata]|uniref:uncharacterized protein LOC128172870 n=1 Tax=Magallana angulata TaxID=2784310 RepID=UPI0022B1DE0A|nr:uncharacterized protein LOC128172870 [Crassostrea angulata]